MFIYAFGSICRGEIDFYSDVDLLVVIDNINEAKNFDPNRYSIYTLKRLKEYWTQGNPFAWHLYKESSLIFSETGIDIIKTLEKPENYTNGINDLIKFKKIFSDSVSQIYLTRDSFLFDLSTVFLSIRNFATCYSLMNGSYNFRRNSALELGENSLQIDKECYKLLESSRLLATRGVGEFPNCEDSNKIIDSLGLIENWMNTLLEDVRV